jgi:hypothetical protein
MAKAVSDTDGFLPRRLKGAAPLTESQGLPPTRNSVGRAACKGGAKSNLGGSRVI